MRTITEVPRVEARLITSNVIREQEERRKREESRRKWGGETREKGDGLRVQLLCHSDYGRAVASFDVNDCDEVGEGKMHVDRRHSLTSHALRRRQSIPIHMRFWTSRYKVTYLVQNHSVL